MFPEMNSPLEMSTENNQTIISHDGIALLRYLHELEGGTLQWEVILKQNLTTMRGENFVLVLAHSDYVNETNIGKYFRNNETKYVIELGSSLEGIRNETKKLLQLQDFFSDKYNLYDLKIIYSSPENSEEQPKAVTAVIVKCAGIVKNICNAVSPVLSYNLRNWKMWVVLLLTLIMLVFLILDFFRPYFVVFATLVLFTLLDVISVNEALEGFSNEGMITIGLLFAIVHPLSHNPILLKLSKIMFGKPRFLPLTLFRIIFPIALLSMFLNNTPIVVAFTPLIVEWAREHDISPSKILIPLSYATVAGGLCTIIGTSTNLVASGLLESYGYQSFSFFELIYIGGILLVTMITYLCLVGVWILPNYKAQGMMDAYSKEAGEKFVTQIQIHEKSPLVDKSKKSILTNIGLKSLDIVKVKRKIETTQDLEVSQNTTVTSVESISPVPPEFKIQKNDLVFFNGLPEDIMNLHSITGIQKRLQNSTMFVEPPAGEVSSNDSNSLFKSILKKIQKKKNVEEEEEAKTMLMSFKDNIQKNYSSLDESQNNSPLLGQSGFDSPIMLSQTDDIKMSAASTTEDEIVNNQPNTNDTESPTKLHSKKPKQLSADFIFLELVVSNSNPLIGSDYLSFEKHYQCMVLAVKHRQSLLEVSTSATTSAETEDVQMKSVSAGDSVLVISRDDFYEKWNETRDFFVISRSNVDPKEDVRKYVIKFRGKEFNLWWWEYMVIPIFIGMITAATAGVPMIKCVMLSVVLMVVFRLINPTKAVSVVDWQLLLLIGSSFGVGLAIKNSGFAEALAELVVYLNIPKEILPAIIFLVTQVCSAVITNTAAVSINLPLALAIAQANGLNERMFGIVVTVAASSDFTSPIGSTTNLVVQGPGSYKFFDFTKVGLPLNIIFLLISGTLIPVIWGMYTPNF
ncbi:hypothetical protein C9374_004792 [Naegleria lovaniensis]|uniref:Citrate transporter-like domain-containing protein n=1 Tax=Naegleria lovaniensis TaxID=51637 RepID=A0AA88GM77_NAELO|nr:uncharacterized protein C9374_004792 [Naegleria lovaniensis]KAG2382825.1 hypothetical protein C9374_004792 [Naegleria lovaniensis]